MHSTARHAGIARIDLQICTVELHHRLSPLRLPRTRLGPRPAVGVQGGHDHVPARCDAGADPGGENAQGPERHSRDCGPGLP